MLTLLFSKSALIFYLFVILTELVTKHGIQEKGTTGKNLILSLADLCGICSAVYLVVYSINTVWWAFIALLTVYIILYKLLRFFLASTLINKKYVRVVAHQGRYFLIPIVILMFLLVKK